MRKTRIFVILIPLVSCALFATVYFWSNPMGEPELRIGFYPSPPWHVRPGESLHLNLTIRNEGETTAKNVNLTLSASPYFTINQSGTNKYSKTLAKLEIGKRQSQPITINVLTGITPGNYTISVTIFAENIPLKSYDYQITVELPHIP